MVAILSSGVLQIASQILTSWNWETWHHHSNMRFDFPQGHHPLCEWQQNWNVYGLACSTYHTAYQSGTNLTREEVLTIEDVWFQLQQREAFSARCELSTIATIPILLCIYVCHQTHHPPMLEIFEDSALESSNTNKGSQK